MAELVSQRKGAKQLGIALSTLQHHVKRGNVRLIDGKVDVDVARIQLARHTDPEQSIRGQLNGGQGIAPGSVGGAGSAPGAEQGGDRNSNGLWNAKEKTERLRGELLELEIAEKHGRLVDASEVHRAMLSKARIARDALMAIAPRIAAQLAAETDAAKVQDLLNAEIRAVCAQIAAGEQNQQSH